MFAWEGIQQNITYQKIVQGSRGAKEELNQLQLMKPNKVTAEHRVKYVKKHSAIMKFRKIILF